MIPKFRAWWIQDEVMTHIDTLEFLQGGIRVSDGCWHEKFLGDEVILMQSTGLKYKNGVEIFEGDFCIQRGEEPYSDENMTLDEDWEYRGVIKFQDLAYWIQDNDGFVKWLGTDCDEIEVIGNIYENPELLEVEG